MPEAHESIEGSWYCPVCDLYLDPSRVTFDERCDTCRTEVVWEQYDDDDDPNA